MHMDASTAFSNSSGIGSFEDLGLVVSPNGSALFCDPEELSPAEFAETFYENFGLSWKKNMPDLMEIAQAMVDHLRNEARTAGREFDALENALALSVVRVAERAQKNENPEFVARKSVDDDGKDDDGKAENKYHNVPHTGNVAVVSLFSSKGMPLKWRLFKLAMAFGHDVDHPGRSNKPGQIYEIEANSFAVVDKVFEECEVSHALRDFGKMMYAGTSINGPAQYLKTIIKLAKEDHVITSNDIYLDTGALAFLHRAEAMKKVMARAADQVANQMAQGAWDSYKNPTKTWEGYEEGLDEKAFKAIFKKRFKEQLEVFSGLSNMELSSIEYIASLHGDDLFPSVVMPVSSARRLKEENDFADPDNSIDFTTPDARLGFLQYVVADAFENRWLRSLEPAFRHFLDRAHNNVIGVDLPKHFIDTYYFGYEAA